MKHNNPLILVITAILLIGGTSVYTYSNYQKLQNMEEDIVVNQKEVREYNELLEKKNKTLRDEIKHFAAQTKLLDKLNKIVPQEAEEAVLTQILEQFFNKHNLANNPIYATKVEFDKKQLQNGYFTIPMDLTLEASYENLIKFLEFVDSSGYLENEIRLLEVRNIEMKPLLRKNRKTEEESEEVEPARLIETEYYQNLVNEVGGVVVTEEIAEQNLQEEQTTRKLYLINIHLIAYQQT